MISIIVPVYNSAPTLEKFLESLINQSYHDYEICLIDDGSTDGSEKICDRYASKDDRIVLVHLDNSGVSTARNVGLSICRGDWVCFVDSDDWVDGVFLQTLGQSVNDGCDIAVSGFNVIKGERSMTYSFDDVRFKIIPENSELFYRLIKSRLLFGPCCKLFNKSIIDKYEIKFPINVDYGEDRIFNYQYLSHVKDVVVISSSLYYYVQSRNDSLSSKPRNDFFDLEYSQWQGLKQLLDSRHLLTDEVKDDLYIELFWIVNDNLVNNKNIPAISYYKYIKKLLSIPEILEIREISSKFKYNPTIKFSITHRLPSLFYFISKL